MILKEGTSLQEGKYRIIRVLGQGGFGITYEAEQPLLRRIVAIKEFFMKNCCERNSTTSQVTIGSGNQKELFEKFRGKFIREAQVIARMEHPHIVRVTDVFEENGTAYYVMENLTGGSLADKVKKEGPLSEAEAEKYILQIADALAYIHSLNTVHLDIKPSNILLNSKGVAVLIDFGISKHYDDTGEQTSSTPVGISKGYAPLEQGRDGDVNQFGPSTDVYALGATFFYLVTGVAPPEASVVNEEGLPKPLGVSFRIWRAIEMAMRPRRKERPQSIAEFLKLLGVVSFAPSNDVEETALPIPINHSKRWKWLIPLLCLCALVASAVTALLIHELRREMNIRVFAPEVVAVSDKFNVSIEIEGRQPSHISFYNTDFDDDVHSFLLPRIDHKADDLSIWNSAFYADKAGSYVIRASAKGRIKHSISIPITVVEVTHEGIDLGLSVEWATCNIGAFTPEESGYYFAWGELSPKNEYYKNNYFVYNDYNRINSRLDLFDDAAHMNWGGNWRIPTEKEMEDLCTKCIWTWILQDGKEGYKVTSKINGNSIFLPSAGFRIENELRGAGEGHYWSSDLNPATSGPVCAETLFFNKNGSGDMDWIMNQIYQGLPIRPVSDR